MRAEPAWVISAVKNDATAAWWDAAEAAFLASPDSVPESIHFLVDPTWKENEVAATRQDIRKVQTWATSIHGWNSQKSPLEFNKI